MSPNDGTDTISGRRVLFVGEAVTMAHALRPWTLARALDPSTHEVHLALDPRHTRALLQSATSANVIEHRIHTISPRTFGKRLADGSPVYVETELHDYVEDDLSLLDQVRPDVVVSDFRITMPIAAQLRGIPHITLMHAHWGPWSRLPLPAPDLPLERILGATLLQAVFRLAAPFAFRLHARAFNRVRTYYGLAPVRGIREMYTAGDRVLYLDVPDLAPTAPLPSHHRLVGMLPVEPPVALPSWAHRIPRDRPVAFLTPGSSGNPKVIAEAIEALVSEMTVIVARAGRMSKEELPPGVLSEEFLPGSWACERADVIVCNGGAGSVGQALQAGKPVLALPSNLDQHLSTAALVLSGAGLTIRSRHITAVGIQQAIRTLLRDGSFRGQARAVADRAALFDATSAVQEEIADLVPRRQAVSSHAIKLPMPRRQDLVCVA